VLEMVENARQIRHPAIREHLLTQAASRLKTELSGQQVPAWS